MKANHPTQLMQKWARRNWLLSVLCASLLCALIYVAYSFGWVSSLLSMVALIVGILSLFKLYTSAKPSLDDVAQLTHLQNPSLEHSARLLYTTPEQHGLLALQKQKAEEAFSSFEYALPFYRILAYSTLIVLSSIVGSSALHHLTSQSSYPTFVNEASPTPSATAAIPHIKDVDSAYIEQLIIKETPPDYIGANIRYHDQSNIKIREGSTVTWIAKTKGQIDKLYFRFSENDELDATSRLTLTKQFFESDFYQYGYYNQDIDFISDFYNIQVQPDYKADILVEGLEEYTKLPWNQNHRVTVDIAIGDDYGITDAYIVATVAKGSGESVKFREKKFDLQNFRSGSRTYKGVHSFSTAALDMEPGDELYFHIRAKDNYPYRERWAKSTTYFISIQDTTTYDYIDEGGLAVDLMPDFFRSQRQIIIDSEQLLKDKANISKDSFNRASNSLGFDQKMLRLKYGQFLGEENESGIDMQNEIESADDEHNHHHDQSHDHDHAPTEKLTSARALLQRFMHDHDNQGEHDHSHDHGSTEEDETRFAKKGGTVSTADDLARPTWVEELSHSHDDADANTFHDMSVKSKLKAALSIMWDAELHLRLYDPSSSLPFQYQSLDLLQEIKNHARIYVHRIGFDPPSIKENELRLQGDLDEVSNPIASTIQESRDDYVIIKSLVEAMGTCDFEDATILLESARPVLAKVSLDQPETVTTLSLATQILRQQYMDENECTDLRHQLIYLLPEEAEAISQHQQKVHEITRSVAKKLSF